MREERQHVRSTEWRNRRDAQPMLNGPCLSRPSARPFPQRADTPLAGQAIFLGQTELSRGALKPHAEPALETLDVLVRRDQRHAEFRCGSSHEADHAANAFDA